MSDGRKGVPDRIYSGAELTVVLRKEIICTRED